MTSVFLHSEIGDASMTCYGVLAGEGETGNFHRVGNSPSAWRVWDFSVLFVSYVHVLVPYQGIPRWCRVKSPPASEGDSRDGGFILGLGRSPGVGNDNPLEYSCLENPMDRGAWWATVQGVAELDRTAWLSLYTQACVRLDAAAVLVVGLRRSHSFPSSIVYMCVQCLWFCFSSPLGILIKRYLRCYLNFLSQVQLIKGKEGLLVRVKGCRACGSSCF